MKKWQRQIQLLQNYRQKTEFMTHHEFGGQLLQKSHAKTSRPYSRSRKMHFVFSVRELKWGKKLLLQKERRRLDRRIEVLKKRFSIRISARKYQMGMIQLICQSDSRSSLNHFLRSFTGQIARQLSGAEKGTQKISESFFTQRPFSRILKKWKFVQIMQAKQTRQLVLALMIPATPIFSSA